MDFKTLNTCTMICWAVAALAGILVFAAAWEPTSFIAALLVGVAFGGFMAIIFTRLICGGGDATGGHAALTPGAGASGEVAAGLARGHAPSGDPAPNAGAIAARAEANAPKPNPPEPNPPVGTPPRGTRPELPEEEIAAAQVARAEKAALEESRRRHGSRPVNPTETINTNQASTNAGVMAERAAASAPKANAPEGRAPEADAPRGTRPGADAPAGDAPEADAPDAAVTPVAHDPDLAKEAEAAESTRAEAADEDSKVTAEEAADASEPPAPVAAPAAVEYREAESTPDFDGDGVREGTEEGSRPEMLSEPREGGADNLKEIKGIGPKLEKLCNSMGVYHFDQIANWTADEIAWVDANLQGFKGRVSRDEWVAQAKILASGGDTEFSKRVEDGDVY